MVTDRRIIVASSSAFGLGLVSGLSLARLIHGELSPMSVAVDVGLGLIFLYLLLLAVMKKEK